MVKKQWMFLLFITINSLYCVIPQQAVRVGSFGVRFLSSNVGRNRAALVERYKREERALELRANVNCYMAKMVVAGQVLPTTYLMMKGEAVSALAVGVLVTVQSSYHVRRYEDLIAEAENIRHQRQRLEQRR